MRWTDDRGGNVEDRRGLGGGAVVGGGLGTLIIAAIIFFLGGDPSSILSSGAGSGSPRTEQRELTAEDKKIGEMVFATNMMASTSKLSAAPTGQARRPNCA